MWGVYKFIVTLSSDVEFIGMNSKRFLLVALIILSVSCNFLAQGLNIYPTDTLLPPTATQIPTLTPRPPSTLTATPFPASAYIPPECQNQALATVPAETVVAEPTQSPETNPPLSKTEQLKVFDELTATISQVYLYPDFHGLDWPGTVKKYRTEIENGLDTQAFYLEMGNLVTALGDNHSQFQSPAEVAAANAELAGKQDYVGIGTVVDPLLDKGRFTILSVFPNSAAAHSGLKPHDSLIAVDGIPLVQNGQPYSQRIRGPECSVARITVQSPGEGPRDVVLVRYKVTSSEHIEAHLVKTTDGSRIGYISIPTFFDETIPDQIEQALKDFGPLDGLILDNRWNGGGAVTIGASVLSFFTSGTVGQFVGQTDKRPFQIDANPINNSKSVPLVVLVGGETASFGELFAGILQDEGRAKVVGQNSMGVVEILSPYNFDDGSQAYIAHERFDPTHSHANWEGHGITPDATSPSADWDTFTFDNDPAITASLAVLGHQ